MDDSQKDQLIRTAKQAQLHAHAPYSGFSVGAAILSDRGSIYGGCNVENASYPLGQCAEATAIGTMICSGDHNIQAIVIVSPDENYCYPCGGCRQRIAEFAGDDVPIILSTASGNNRTFTVAELLPQAFRLNTNHS